MYYKELKAKRKCHSLFTTLPQESGDDIKYAEY